MEEAITVQHEKFFRPDRRREERSGERFQRILKKAIRTAFQLLLLSFFLFVGHRIYDHLLEDPFFRVREIELQGCQRIPRESLLSLVRVENMRSLFAVSLSELGKPLESHPWVDQVRIRKVFPDKIMIQIEERKPIAILQLEEPYYIDTKGVIFSSVGDRDEYDYPFLTGLTREVLDRNPEEAKNLIMKSLELLRTAERGRKSPLYEISEIHMERNYGMRCFTRTHGVEFKMGWDRFEEKLERVSLVWSDLQKREVPVASIDCDDLKRIVVKRVSRKSD